MNHGVTQQRHRGLEPFASISGYYNNKPRRAERDTTHSASRKRRKLNNAEPRIQQARPFSGGDPLVSSRSIEEACLEDWSTVSGVWEYRETDLCDTVCLNTYGGNEIVGFYDNPRECHIFGAMKPRRGVEACSSREVGVEFTQYFAAQVVRAHGAAVPSSRGRKLRIHWKLVGLEAGGVKEFRYTRELSAQEINTIDDIRRRKEEIVVRFREVLEKMSRESRKLKDSQLDALASQKRTTRMPNPSSSWHLETKETPRKPHSQSQRKSAEQYVYRQPPVDLVSATPTPRSESRSHDRRDEVRKVGASNAPPLRKIVRLKAKPSPQSVETSSLVSPSDAIVVEESSPSDQLDGAKEKKGKKKDSKRKKRVEDVIFDTVKVHCKKHRQSLDSGAACKRIVKKCTARLIDKFKEKRQSDPETNIEAFLQKRGDYIEKLVLKYIEKSQP